MAKTEAKLILSGQDQSKPAFDSIRRNLGKMGEGAKQAQNTLNDLKAEVAGFLSLAAVGAGLRSAIVAVRQAEASFKGLESVANFTGVGIERAFDEATQLTKDNLLSLGEASQALQNLLSRGYSVDQAVQTINRLKDAAAFNRAAHLQMGEAVVTATEGLKQENSVLVDNAGVQKNVSVLWKEHADAIGKAVGELTQAEKIQAEVNGILRETEAQVGNAAKAAGGLEGNIAKLNKAQNELATAFGTALIPAITNVTAAGTRAVNEWIKPFLGGIEILSIKLAAFVKSSKDFFSGNFAAIEENWRLADEMAQEVVERYESGIIPAAQQAKDNIDKEAIARRQAAAAAEEQRKKAEEQAKAQGKITDRIDKTIARLKVQAATLGLNSVEAELYKLKLEGASAAQLDAARTALQAVEAHKALEEQHKLEAKAAEEAADKEAQIARTLADSTEQVLNTIDPLRALQKEEERLAILRDRQLLTAEEYALALEDLQQRMREVESDGDQMSQFAIQAARNIQSSFADFLFDPFKEGMDGMLTGFTNMLRRMAAELAAQELLKAIFGGLSGGSTAGDGSFGGFMASIAAGINHDGGIAGGAGRRRNVSAAAFIGAPRFHSGGILGLSPNEVPAILERGEEVLTRNDPRHAANGGGMPLVTVNIQAIDDRSLLERMGTIRQELAIGVAQAMRQYNLGSS